MVTQQKPLKQKLSVASLCTLAATSFAINAQGAEQAESVFTLGTVNVYGIKENDAQKAETRIDRDQIQLLEKNDIGEALKMTPGIFYTPPGGGRYESGIMMRGYSLREVPIFMDGVPVYIPYDGYSDLGRFTTSDVSSIRVAKGYSSVMYGHNALGGVINIVSMRPSSELDADATVGMGSGGVKQMNANVGTLQDKWYLQAGVSYFERDYQRLSENYVGTDALKRKVDSNRYNYHTEDRRGSIKIGFIPNATDEYVLSYSKQEAKKRPTDHDNGFKPTEWEWPKWNRETISFVSNTRFLNNSAYIKPRVYYDKFQNTMDWWRGQPKGSHYDDSAFGASVELGTEAIAKHDIKLMFSYKDEQHKSFDTDIYSRALLPDTNQKVKQKFYSIALEDTYSISDQWQTQIGAIYTRRTADAMGLGSNIRDFLNKHPQNGNVLNPSINSFDPQIALFYKPTTVDTFKASISKKTRFPSFKQAYSNFGDEFVNCPKGMPNCGSNNKAVGITLQNPGLKPERAIHFEVGYEGRPIDDLHLEASLYYSRSKDAMDRTDYDFTSYPGYAVRQSVNVDGTTERKGLDLGLMYDFTPQLGLGVSYAYLHIRNKEDRDYRFSDMPRHFGMAYAEIRPTPWLAVIPSVEFRSNSYADTKGINKNHGYGIANLKLEFTPETMQNLAFNVGVNNVLNKNYAQFNDQFASPGRSYYANVRMQY